MADPRQREIDIRARLLETLLERVAQERHPSVTMMTLIEQLLTPEDRPLYAEVLMDKIRSERFPSVSMMLRVSALTS